MLKRTGSITVVDASLTLTLSAGARATDPVSAYKHLENTCLGCHGDSATMQNRIAPPMIAVEDHYLTAYPERVEFISAVVNRVEHPSTESTQMPGAIRRFGVMPARSIDTQTLEAIAALIHDTGMRKPDWYEEHRQSEHGHCKPNPVLENNIP